MRGNKGYMDMGAIFDEIFEAARNFRDEFQQNFDEYGRGGHFGPGGLFAGRSPFDENIDYYPNYSFPPMNIFMTGDRSMVFEFALAGFSEKDISLSFQGDYMVFSARIPTEQDAEGDYPNTTDGETRPPEGNVRYFKRRLKLKDIEKQKYYVPLDKYAQEKVKAVYKNGILKVIVPPKDEPDQNDGIKIEIIKDDNLY